MRNIRWIAGALGLAMSVTAAMPASAAAWERGHDRGSWHGDIRFFHVHDFPRWRGGSWFHGRHAGRAGWWWIVGGSWYFFARPVYPYPDPYVPPTVIVQPQVSVATPPPPSPPQTLAQTWYYCQNPQGYYPYVASCPGGWSPVPANPASPPPAAVP